MYNPAATYRIQFHKDFPFATFQKMIPYLKELGITTVYASPLFSSVPGSTHGYDGVNPLEVNPEIGTEEEFKELATTLKEHGIGWLQDIVPNHMAFDHRNKWLMDVLEKGLQSPYATFFDTGLTDSFYKGQLMVPFLRVELDDAIRNNELKLDYKEGRFVICYYDQFYPLNPRSYAKILDSSAGKPNQSVQQLIDQMPVIKQEEEASIYAKQWDEFLYQLTSLYKNDVVRNFVDEALQQYNAPEKLKEILDEQMYRLCHWQEADRAINYRRFFTVNGLICLNIQDENVFTPFHQKLKQWLDEGMIQGLRVDHIDGLYDPSTYLQRLRELAGDETYITVEKILEPGETLPNWPVQGNTGYDFLSMVNNLFTCKKNEEVFTQFYEDLVDDARPIRQHLRNKKSAILYEHMQGDLENLYRLFMTSNLVDKRVFASVRPEDLKSAIGEMLIHCPVYRFYPSSFPLPEKEARDLQQVLNSVKRNSELIRAVSLLEQALLHKPHEGDSERNKRAQHFYRRCMQFTGPLMAKGMEDTLMYTYNRLIGHNEVGDSPEAFGYTIDEFHQKMLERQQTWPLSMNATATHDTKRGEDARARLNVVSELADDWMQAVLEWRDLTKNYPERAILDVNDEYFIYQTLISTYPFENEGDYKQRLQEYLQKALREAKTYSSWTNPDEDYEQAAQNFAATLLDPSKPFWQSFTSLHQKISELGIVNSLSQLVLKFTCPGIPDVYQGTEFWDFSFVDPDNRRPVNYEQRVSILNADKEKDDAGLKELWDTRTDAHLKLWLTQKLYALRQSNPDFFIQAQYIPLQVEGHYKEHVFAFARRYKQTIYIIAVPLFVATLIKEQETNFENIDWKNTRILLPKEVSGDCESLISGYKGKTERGLPIKEAFSQFPFLIAKANIRENKRSAGVLIHISSLNTLFGIGDMGPEAKAFANFLHRTHQRIWQLLPINPIEGGQGYSPYSSISSRAGNPLLISPELLAREGYVSRDELHQYHLPISDTIDYASVEEKKEKLFDKAWQSFKQKASQNGFEKFCTEEKQWLNDFALYKVFKQQHSGKPWYDWPQDFKNRNEKALQSFALAHEEEITKTKFIQYLFLKQWKDLKEYCNSKGIQLIGDLPFYVSYDSVDVWSNRDLFAVDEEGRMTGMAGVPPDAFSDDGQLWGMPVYNWSALAKQDYKWWIDRFRKNIALFDLVRLDHFRAFADYWEVPAGEQTARNGVWKEGPGAHFFQVVEKELGELPFIAEDLGDINDAVLRLRDEFSLPGMNVLQFAFGEDMPRSVHIPHNYIQNSIVYTGTHDNNTIAGWYKNEAGDHGRQRLFQYLGRPVSSDEVHHAIARLAYGSVSRMAIIPVQDILGLDESTRMNKPASGEGNWAWRMLPGQITPDVENWLRQSITMYNRK